MDIWRARIAIAVLIFFMTIILLSANADLVPTTFGYPVIVGPGGETTAYNQPAAANENNPNNLHPNILSAIPRVSWSTMFISQSPSISASMLNTRQLSHIMPFQSMFMETPAYYGGSTSSTMPLNLNNNQGKNILNNFISMNLQNLQPTSQPNNQYTSTPTITPTPKQTVNPSQPSSLPIASALPTTEDYLPARTIEKPLPNTYGDDSNGCMIKVKLGDVFHIRLFEVENWTVIITDGLEILDSRFIRYSSHGGLVPQSIGFSHYRDWDIKATKRGVQKITATNPQEAYDSKLWKPYMLTVYVE